MYYFVIFGANGGIKEGVIQKDLGLIVKKLEVGRLINQQKSLALFLVWAILCCMMNLAQAAEGLLDPIDLSVHKHGDTTVDQYIYYREAFGEDLTLREAIGLEEWKTPEPKEVNRGFFYSPVWMKFLIKNPSPEEKELIVEYVDAAAETIDIYYRPYGSEEEFTHHSFVYKDPVVTRPISFYRPAFPVDTPADSITEVYIRIFQGNEFPMHSFTSMRIWGEKEFYRSAHIELMMLIVLLCTEAFMALATFIAFISTREKLFLYYACFAVSGALLFSGLSGVWGYFISPDGYELWQVVFQISLCQVAAILFVRKFLKTDVHMPWVDALLVGMVWIDCIGIILNLSGSPYFSRIIIDYTAIAYFALLPIGLYSHKKGVPHALLFTSSWVVFIVGMGLASMRFRGYIPDTFIAEWLIYFGGFIEVFLLTTIMVLRIRDMQREKNEIEASHKRYLEQAANELALKVDEQTQQLMDAKQKAEKEARTDILTGLTNRRSFFELAAQYIERANRSEKPNLYLLMIDVDHFKRVNDTFGHAAGDQVLVTVSDTINETIRNIDLLSRLGGEEFAVLFENDGIEGAAELAERLRRSVEKLEVVFEHKLIEVTISVGLSDWSKKDTLHTLMRKADQALYKAKEQGRNRIVISHEWESPKGQTPFKGMQLET